MSRCEWRCRNADCAAPQGTVLGKLTVDGNGLALHQGVIINAVYLDTGRIEIRCPRCGTVRSFRGGVVRSANT